jgi:transcriptional regulator with XRE-family HTH domain
MEKSIHSSGYTTFLALLREKAEVTQVELAARLERTQSFVSKVERGETRLDVLQLHAICAALGTTLPVFAAELDRRLARRPKSGGSKRALTDLRPALFVFDATTIHFALSYGCVPPVPHRLAFQRHRHESNQRLYIYIYICHLIHIIRSLL